MLVGYVYPKVDPLALRKHSHQGPRVCLLGKRAAAGGVQPPHRLQQPERTKGKQAREAGKQKKQGGRAGKRASRQAAMMTNIQRREQH